MQDPHSAGIDAVLHRLQTGIRQLKVQYDMFFVGALPRQPLEQRAELDRLFKQVSSANMKYAQRFHFNALAGRYNSLSELWTKTLRATEEGGRPAPGSGDRARREKLVSSCRVQDPEQEHESLKLLHARYVEARRNTGDPDEKVSFPSFVKGILSQTRRLKDKTGCESIELRIVVQDDKVHLKARPGS